MCPAELSQWATAVHDSRAHSPAETDICPGGIIFCNTAGLTTADLDTFEYVRRVPLYPFEADLQYESGLQLEEEQEEVARL